LFSAEGAKLIIADINKAGENIASQLSASGPQAIFVETNVTRKADWENAVKIAKEMLGGLDILVNNAGWTYTRKDTLLVTEEEYDREHALKMVHTPLLDGRRLISSRSVRHQRQRNLPLYKCGHTSLSGTRGRINR